MSVRRGPYGASVVEGGALWHYAVWKGSVPIHMWPACWGARGTRLQGIARYTGVMHGQTIVRGDVNCPDCLRMMGPGE